MSKVGIISGGGRLPVLIGENLKKKNYEVVFFVIEDTYDREIYSNHTTILIKLNSISKILKSLKERKGTASSSVTSSSSSGGVTVKSKGTLSQPTSSTTNSSEGLSDNIEAKRQAAAENLKEQQQKREDQIKEAIRLKQEQQQAAKKSQQQKSTPQQKPQSRVNIKDQLSRAAKDYSRRETSFSEGTEHQFAKPVEFIKRDIEVPEMIQVGELAKLMFMVPTNE